MTEPIRILFVEDIPDDMELASIELQKDGIAVVSMRVDKENELIQALDSFLPDLVISDYSMPGFDGMEALRIIQQHDQNLPVIMFTGSINEEVAVECMKQGASDYILKDKIARLPYAVKEVLVTKKLWEAREKNMAEKKGYIEELEKLNTELAAARQASLNVMEDLIAEIEQKEIVSKELAESENKFRGIAQQISDLIYITDTEGLIEFISPSSIQLFGYVPEEMVGKHFMQFLEESQIPLAQKKFQAAIETGKREKELIFTMKRKGGTLFQGELQATVFIQDNERVGTLGLIRDITDRLMAEKEIKETAQKLRNLTTHIQEVREEERKEIAQNLHDDLGQKLTALNIDLAWLAGRIPVDLPELSEKINGMHGLIMETATRIKQISSQLRPSILDDLGISAALIWQTNEFSARTETPCKVSIIPEDMTMSEEAGTQVFRIVQEALTNIMRHAEASNVVINLIEKENKWRLRIKDNGKGISEEDREESHSFGLAGMEERAHLCGGTFTIKGAPGKGTEIVVEVPIS